MSSRSNFAAEFAHRVARVGGKAQKLESMAHPISVPQSSIHADLLPRGWSWKADGDALPWVGQPALDHHAQPSFAQAGRMAVQDRGLFRITGFKQDNGQIDVHASESPDTIEITGLFFEGPLFRSGEIPVVMNVLGLTKQLVANRALANAANGKIFAANDNGFVRRTMTREMPHQIDAADRSEFARSAHYFLEIVGSHRTSIFRNEHRSNRNLGNPRPEDAKAQTAAAYIQIIT